MRVVRSQLGQLHNASEGWTSFGIEVRLGKAWASPRSFYVYKSEKVRAPGSIIALTT